MNKIIFADCEKIYNKNDFWDKFINKHIVVTGPYGMIASYIVYLFIYLNEYHNANIKIIAVGRNEEKFKQRFGNFVSKQYFKFFENNLITLPKIENCDYIIHAASPASSQFYGIDPVGTTIPNFLGTYNLLNFAVKHKIMSMLFISSDEVYGKSDREFLTENDFGISNPTEIRYCYGESKRMGECLCKAFSYQYKVPVKTVRLGHTYGPTMDIKNDKRVFSEFVNNIVNNENIVIKSSGNATRTFTYIADVIDGILKVLINGENGEAYNISNPEENVSIKTLANTLKKLSDNNLEIIFETRKINENYIESNLEKHSILGIQKLKNLGWNPEYNIFDGFKRTIESIKLK